MLEGWILDVYPNYEFDTMNVWLWTNRGPKQIVDKFTPCFYVYGQKSVLRECARRLEDFDYVASVSFKSRRLKLESEKRYQVLEVALDSYSRFRELPVEVNRWGRYSRLQLFDVDLRLPQKYMFSKMIFPMAYVKVGSGYRVHDDIYAMDYDIPPMRAVELSITVNGSGQSIGEDNGMFPYASYDEPLSAVRLKNWQEGEEWELEPNGKDEIGLMQDLVEAVNEIDPDIIYTISGDEVIFPYLYHRSSENGLGKNFSLDRDRSISGASLDSGSHNSKGSETEKQSSSVSAHRPEHRGKSYFTYGRIAYKPPFYSLKGRLHIDQRSSFIHRESGLLGLVEIARLSCIPLQTMSRLSPGSAISAIQVCQAMREEVLVKWKKNQPEQFKSATELLVADRGGHIFDPSAGVHDNVVELDFVSLYPSIIARKNISPETVSCRCCGELPSVPRVPALNYHICTKRRGLIPKVVAPIIARRVAYKRRGGESNEARQKMLKWVLVTCFGYTGYRNARFGRIECHESITAFAREIMLDAMEVAEELGYEILHGYVDSLWLRPLAEISSSKPEPFYSYALPAPADVVCREISRRIGIPMELEGHYKWIVFLPNKSVDVGALTRYYGMFSDGSLKIRGIELRQHSTPPLFIRFQADILEEFRKASNVTELNNCLPQVLELVSDYGREIMAGRCDAREMVFNTRVSREREEYRVFSNQLAALVQLDDLGVEVHPGETVSYIIMDSSSSDPYKRVQLSGRLKPDDKYDKQKYLEFLCRAGDSILRPFGYTEDVLAEHLKKTVQTQLDKYM